MRKQDTDKLIKRVARELLFHTEVAIVLIGAGMSTESGIPDRRGASAAETDNPVIEKKTRQK